MWRWTTRARRRTGSVIMVVAAAGVPQLISSWEIMSAAQKQRLAPTPPGRPPRSLEDLLPHVGRDDAAAVSLEQADAEAGLELRDLGPE
jgi:hypothetical protein